MKLKSRACSLSVRSAAVLAIVAVLGLACGRRPEAASADVAQDAAAKDYERGPHRGRLLSDEQLQAEVTIYERGIPPRFRVYLFADGEPVAPTEVTLQIELHRLGGRVDRIAFTPEGTYLVSERVVEEPHSFDVKVFAERGGNRHTWQYSQTEGRVELADEAVRTSAITVETAGPRTMRTVLELPGEIVRNGDKVAHIVPQVAGSIREFRKNQGDTVARGEVLAVLASRDLAEAKRRFLETANELEFARRAFEREQGLWQKNIASEASYLEQERLFSGARLQHDSARQQLQAIGIGEGAQRALLAGPAHDLTRYELRAPFDGVVVEKHVATGQAVQEDQDLLTVADLSSVWVNVTVYAKDLEVVRPGQAVTVTAEAPRAQAAGTIGFVGSLVGEQTRSATARVVLANPEQRWRAGMFVKVEVVQQEVAVPVAVLRSGLQKFRDWDVVFVRVGDLFEARPLELGRADGDWIEVLSGLSPGERYAAENSFILKADVGKAGASHDH